jgi:D-sedoheptulose 7-phosphate isomerase
MIIESPAVSLKTKIIRRFEENAAVQGEMARRCSGEIGAVIDIIIKVYRAGGKVVIFGNGGSAADAQHIAAEMMGRFLLERQAFPAIALTTNSSVLTALSNDYGYDQVFKRQVEAILRQNDVAIGISTTGNSPNVIEGISAAKKKER